MKIQYFINGQLKFTAKGNMIGKNFVGKMIQGQTGDCYLKNPVFQADKDQSKRALIVLDEPHPEMYPIDQV